MRSTLLQLTGTLVLTLTVIAAILYAGFMVVWMHAPVGSVITVTLALAALPAATAWGLFKLSKRVKP